MTPDGPARRSVTVDGFTWRLIDAGAGPAVLLCHGFLGVADVWTEQVRALSDNGFRAIAVDLPDHGGTDRPGDLAGYSPASIADGLAALLTELGVADVVAVGHDLGSAVAWTLGRRHRERVRGLMLMSLPYAPDRAFERVFSDTGAEAAQNWCRAIQTDRATSAGDDLVLDVPAYFLDGENDTTLSVIGEDAMGRMREMMPGLRAVHTYDGAGRLIMSECAREVNAALIGFVRGLS